MTGDVEGYRASCRNTRRMFKVLYAQNRCRSRERANRGRCVIDTMTDLLRWSSCISTMTVNHVHVATSLHSSERVRWQVPANSNLDAFVLSHRFCQLHSTPCHSFRPCLDQDDNRSAPPATRAGPSSPPLSSSRRPSRVRPRRSETCLPTGHTR